MQSRYIAHLEEAYWTSLKLEFDALAFANIYGRISRFSTQHALAKLALRRFSLSSPKDRKEIKEFKNYFRFRYIRYDRNI